MKRNIYSRKAWREKRKCKKPPALWASKWVKSHLQTYWRENPEQQHCIYVNSIHLQCLPPASQNQPHQEYFIKCLKRNTDPKSDVNARDWKSNYIAQWLQVWGNSSARIAWKTMMKVEYIPHLQHPLIHETVMNENEASDPAWKTNIRNTSQINIVKTKQYQELQLNLISIWKRPILLQRDGEWKTSILVIQNGRIKMDSENKTVNKPRLPQ